ncbi:insulinase family protein [Candidatus Peregrinibacteria bacterium]|jgi:predicted Zn-dependent peptidase|nr:insulinase family protein [Candidatus Peregrinibacteria bacterium]MBT4147923.1 insulinase family protein [Candidatus Peregrinibacteria bacterium]MBT4365974.1 insulinase family protein [Candidatus Peregrinibacteria bacterium]MBT4456414.1 insulinase family protein [Candidatus Peregrinibacteria bacterium]
MKKTTLSNGLRVVTHKLESTKAVTVLVLVGAGSRYENKEISGISHFLEHMFFKGAEKYKDAKAVSGAIDSVGGDFNAFTGKEYAGYYVKVASEKVDTAFDVLSDMMLHARFDQHEIDKERGVILEEYNMYQDTPMYQIGWNYENLMFGDQPLGWDEIGEKEVIERVNHEDFVEYKEKLYTSDNTVVVVAGNIAHDEALEKVEKFFAMERGEKAYDFEKYSPLIGDAPRVHLKEKKTEQAHLVIGVEAYSETHPDHWVLKLLSVILGGNMSSRMFLNVREAHGLAYYIRTNTDDYVDTGLISTTAGVDIKRAEMAVEKIVEQYGMIAKAGEIDADELAKAKSFLKGKMILSLEDSEEYAHLLAKFELLHKDVMTPDEIMREINAVSLADVERVAADLFGDSSRLKMAIIGPYSDPKVFERLLKY